jgi:hypothetical protein
MAAARCPFERADGQRDLATRAAHRAGDAGLAAVGLRGHPRSDAQPAGGAGGFSRLDGAGGVVASSRACTRPARKGDRAAGDRARTHHRSARNDPASDPPADLGAAFHHPARNGAAGDCPTSNRAAGNCAAGNRAAGDGATGRQDARYRDACDRAACRRTGCTSTARAGDSRRGAAAGASFYCDPSGWLAGYSARRGCRRRPKEVRKVAELDRPQHPARRAAASSSRRRDSGSRC